MNLWRKPSLTLIYASPQHESIKKGGHPTVRILQANVGLQTDRQRQALRLRLQRRTLGINLLGIDLWGVLQIITGRTDPEHMHRICSPVAARLQSVVNGTRGCSDALS